MTEVASTMHFMHHVIDFVSYSHEAVPGFQVMMLRFTGALSMIFALPTSESSGDVASATILEALPQLALARMAVALPKFQFESEYKNNLKAALQAIGLTAPFDGGLCIYASGGCALIDKIIQKTFINLNEDGVEAAAVTAIILVSGLPPPETPILFMADHPFQFFIYDSTEELVIFEGRVGNPSVADDAPVPQLQASHSESGFWQTYFGVDEPIVPDLSNVTPRPTPQLTDDPTPQPTDGTPSSQPTDDPTPKPSDGPPSSTTSLRPGYVWLGVLFCAYWLPKF